MVYPSLYEGFGVSITEAFTYQCPVLCSNTGAFPEIGGEAPLYFDPNDMSNMKDALNYFLKYGDSHEMIDKGEKQLEKFTLKDTIQKTIKVYKQFDK